MRSKLSIFTKIFIYLKQKIFINKVISTSQPRLNFFHWEQEAIHSRLMITIFVFILCFFCLIYRLISVTSHHYLKSIHTDETNNLRREIVDRNGEYLAVNIPSSSLYLNPNKAVDLNESLKKLSKIIPILDFKKIHKEVKDGKKFIWIHKDITPKLQNEILSLGLSGFNFEKENRRVYTFGNILSHIIGYVGRDFIGLAGLERSYDKFLSDHQSNKGKNLQLSIDVRLQTILSEEIDKTIKDFTAKGGAGVIIDPNNGEILALVSKPDFDPHNPASASKEALFNAASHGAFEIGSVFKALTIAIGIDTNATTIHDAYDLTYMKVGKFVLKDYHPMKGFYTVPEIFLHSSNIGVAQIMLEVGRDNLKQYLKKLGLLNQLQIEIPERSFPLYPSDEKWNDLSTVTMSYGYGLSISPLHFAQSILPMVNGGYKVPLTLIKSQSSVKHTEDTRVFKESTCKAMKQLFRLVVKEGTGRNAEVKGYLVGGKTGTANKQINGKYAQKSHISSFIAIMPASAPKYVIYIMIDDPKGTKETHGFSTAGWTAAPAVRRVIEKMVTLYGLDPIDENDIQVQEIMNMDYKIENRT